MQENKHLAYLYLAKYHRGIYSRFFSEIETGFKVWANMDTDNIFIFVTLF